MSGYLLETVRVSFSSELTNSDRKGRETRYTEGLDYRGVFLIQDYHTSTRFRYKHSGSNNSVKEFPFLTLLPMGKFIS